MERTVFERVVKEQRNRVYTYATMMLRNATEAQDVTQEAMVRLWKHRDTVDDARAQLWLKRTTHNLCIDRMRRKKTRGEVGTEVLEQTSQDPSAGPQRIAESDQLGEQIEKALEKMHPRDRAVLLLREVQQLSYAEISEILDVNLGTLKARLHRARENLRERLVRAGVTP
jgi:RNA polymerase sigma-70 factor (ECF subfamily)